MWGWTFKFELGKVPTEYQKDTNRILKAVANVTGGVLHPSDAYSLWSQYSGSLCAGWIILPDTDEEIVEKIMRKVDDLHG